MKDWFPIEGVDVSPFRFMPDGSYLVGTLKFDLSTQLGGSSIGGFTLDSDGSELVVTDQEGVTLRFRYQSGEWLCDHQLSKSQQGPEPHEDRTAPTGSPPPVKVRHGFDYYAYRVAAVLALAIVFFYLIVPKIQPLANLLPMNMKDAKVAADKADRQAENEAIQTEVKIAHERATQSFTQLDRAADSISAQVKTLLSVGIDELNSASARPRELDLAILQDDEAAKSWAAIQNAYVSRLTRGEHRKTLDAVAARLAKSEARREDAAAMNELSDNIKRATASLQALPPTIRPLETAVVAARKDAELRRAHDREP